jgi:hypothetical protein
MHDLWYDPPMTATPETKAFDRGVRPILRMVLLDKADVVLNFRPDPELQARIETLATKSTEGELTAQERAEYEGYVRANKFVAILQRQARQMVDTTL